MGFGSGRSAARRWRMGLAAADVLRDLAEFVWPRRCWLCGALPSADGDAAGLPEACDEHRLAPAVAAMAGRARCGRCDDALAPGLRDRSTCARCRRRPLGLGTTLCAVDYGDPAVPPWVLRFKHGGRRDLAVPLAAVVATAVAARGAGGGGRPVPGRGDLLVPVPLHAGRLVERGYDQAGALAAELEGAGLGRRVPLLRRTRPTVPQGTPEGPARARNVRGAFRVARGARLLGDRRVWLVDDVVTSGSTLAACATTLREAGLRDVHALALARA